MIRVLLPFGTGTLIAATLLKGNDSITLAFLLCLAGIGFLGYKLFINQQARKKEIAAASIYYRNRWINGIILLTMALAAGSVNVWLHTAINNPGFFADSISQNDNAWVQITVPLQDKGAYYKTTAKIIALGTKTRMHSANGNLLIYFQKDSADQYPVYGDQVIIKNKIVPLKTSENPGDFDFKTYMSYQDIYHSAYLKVNEWHATGNNAGNPFWKSIYTINTRLKKELWNALPDPDQRGIAEALILGDESDIPNEIMTEYAGTGTVHILSVSGLHVGLILIGLSWIFSFLTLIPNGKYIRLILILAIIWAYAFLTGFSAPIARSVIMFSIVFIGIHLGRNTNIYNSIAASAFILLLIDPFLIMQASCRLSFIALTGIVWLQPKIASFWQPRHKIVKYIWIMTAASIAAQIITFPVSVYYFNQASIYFLPANLIVIPASFVILIIGIAFVFTDLSILHWLHHWFSVMLKYSIYVLNIIVGYFNHLPGSTWKGLYISRLESVLLFCFIVICISGFIYRKKMFLGAGLILGILFFSTRNIAIFNRLSGKSMAFFTAGSKHTVITLKEHNQLFVLTDTGFTNDKQLMKFHINSYAAENYIRPENIVCVNPEINHKFSGENMMVQGSLIGFYNKTALVINSKTYIKSLISNAAPMEIDALVLSDNPSIGLSELYKKFRFKSVVAASGNKTANIRDWETICIENNIPFTNLQNNDYIDIPI